MKVSDQKLEVITQDPHICLINKPSGLLSVEGRTPSEASAKALLAAQLRRPVWTVHRIDRETSGLLLFALTAEAHRSLSMAFEKHRVVKRYRAIALGAALPDHSEIELPLHPARKGKMRPTLAHEQGLNAHTALTVLKRWSLPEGQAAELRLCPSTGRQHQLRVHLRALGAPLLFDPLYRLAEHRAIWPDAPLQRTALHAEYLRFDHPVTQSTMAFECAPEPSWQALIDWLSQRAQARH